MAVTRLNADALPFYGRFHASPLPPASMSGWTAYHGAVAGRIRLPFVPRYPCAPFGVRAHLHPQYSYYYYPRAPPAPYLCKGGVPFPPRAGPTAALYIHKRGPSAPHGFPPRNLIFVGTGAAGTEKQQAQERAAAARPYVPPQPQAWSRGRNKQHIRRKPVRSPSPVFTTRPPCPVPALAWLGNPSTVMIRNIPNKLTFAGMMELLDDHCARANRRRPGVLSAYDFLYLPIDFSSSGQRSSNMGYAFVNFTTAAAARRLHGELHGGGWKMEFGSAKVIAVCPARIQGKKALVRHFTGSTFACRTNEYLPAVFSPPRDGAGAGAGAAEPRRVGHRTCRRPSTLLTTYGR